MPSASPRRAGGYQEFTKGMLIAKVVPPSPRKNPPIRYPVNEPAPGPR